MKKKVLFVIPSLRGGGAEKSLISVLSLFDYEKYEVDLLLFRRDGMFLEKLPPEINFLYDTTDFETFDGDGKTAVMYFLKKLDFSAAADRIRYLKTFKETDMVAQETESWKYLRRRLPKMSKKYDCAISYLEGNANNFVADCVKADRKICYVHNDISRLPYNDGFYRNSFSRCDAVVTVSQLCYDSLVSHFPEYSGKYHIIENITSRRIILADADIPDDVYGSRDEAVILTVGRCSEQKNIGLAAEACRELRDRGRKIKWYHIGKGEDEEKVRAYAEELGIAGSFIMLGEKSNPYPYMAQCDIYVQPSRFEGKSIAVDEVKCLHKPMVVTDYPSVNDQVRDGVNGLICKMNRTDMADKIEMLIDSPGLRGVLSGNLQKEDCGNENELKKLYKLIDG